MPSGFGPMAAAVAGRGGNSKMFNVDCSMGLGRFFVVAASCRGGVAAVAAEVGVMATSGKVSGGGGVECRTGRILMGFMRGTGLSDQTCRTRRI